MLITQKQLKKVIVETQSGQLLGIIVGFELETDTGVIEKYYVAGKVFMSGLWASHLIINRSQIIDFNAEKMIVEDAAVKVRKAEQAKLAAASKLEGAEPVITSEVDN